MKVLLFIPQLDAGGPDRVFFELASHFPAMNIEVTVLVQQAGGYYWDKLADNIKKISLYSDNNASNKRKYPVLAYAQKVREIAPDVVLCTLRCIFTAVTARLFARIKNPLVIRPANHITKNSRELLRQSPVKHSLSWLINICNLYVADHVICQSQDIFSDLRSYGVPEKKLTIIGNPMSQQSESAYHGALPGKPALLAVGRLMKQKGFDLLIAAIAQLKEELPELELTILGEGEEAAALSAQASALEVSDRVHMPGFSANAKALMAAADFLVSSSRYEGFPNVVLEALTAGTPVIATDCPGGTRELVITGLTGWLCQPESAAALSQAIHQAYLERKLMSANIIQEFICRRFSAAAIAERYVQILRSTILRVTVAA